MRIGAITFAGILSLAALWGLSACGSTTGNNCAAGLSDCEGTCVNTQADGDNCGACGTVCGAGQACMAGACESVCPQGQIECGGSCIDPDANTAYCGATGDCQGANAGAQCPAGFMCTDGACACDAPYTECVQGEVCVNIDNNTSHCGACYNECANGASCIDGVCRAAVTYVGALTPTNGRWSYGGIIGMNGANAECDANWSGSRICTGEELMYAAMNNELTNAMDTAGSTVNAFWYDNALELDTLQCVHLEQENARWTYPTAHLGVMGHYAALDNATGVLDPPAVGNCNSGMYNVACCNESVVIP